MHGIVFVRIGFMTLMALALSLASATPAHGSPHQNACPITAIEESIGYLAGEVKRGIVPPLSGKAFAILAVREVDGLRRDGTRDPRNRLPVALLIYQLPGSRPQVSWWFHEYGDPGRAIRDPNMGIVAEQIKAEYEAVQRSLPPAERKALEDYTKVVTTKMVSRHQIKWHGAGTVIDLSDVPQRHREWARADIEALSAKSPTIIVTDKKVLSDLSLAEVQFDEAMLLKSETETSFSGAKFTMQTVNRGGVLKAVVSPKAELPAPALQTQRIYVEGNAPSPKQYAAYDRAKIDVLVRSSKSARPLREVDKDLDSTRVLSRPAIFNGLPSTAEAIRAQALAPTESKTWLALHKEITELFAREQLAARSTKQELLSELQTGTADVLVVYAHSTGKTLYLGSEALTLAELEALPPRRATTRTVVLVSCSTGKPGASARLSRSSFAEVLLSKGFAGEVIAPDGVVEGVDVPKLLQRAFQTPIGDLVRWLRTNFEKSGWTRRVELVIARRSEVG